jgi:hypothetical protein
MSLFLLSLSHFYVFHVSTRLISDVRKSFTFNINVIIIMPGEIAETDWKQAFTYSHGLVMIALRSVKNDNYINFTTISWEGQFKSHQYFFYKFVSYDCPSSTGYSVTNYVQWHITSTRYTTKRRIHMTSYLT